MHTLHTYYVCLLHAIVKSSTCSLCFVQFLSTCRTVYCQVIVLSSNEDLQVLVLQFMGKAYCLLVIQPLLSLHTLYYTILHYTTFHYTTSIKTLLYIFCLSTHFYNALAPIILKVVMYEYCLGIYPSTVFTLYHPFELSHQIKKHYT